MSVTSTNDDGMTTLSSVECERLLASGGVGVIALCGSSAPVLRPVNFTPYRGRIVVRTGEGQILAAARGGQPASFVFSQSDRFEHTGWSVIASGTLVEDAALGEDAALRLRPWARAEKHRFVALSIDELSGRRIGGPAESSNDHAT